MGNSDVSQAKGHESVANHRRCNNPQLDRHWLIGFHAKPFGEDRIISTFQGFSVLAGTRPSGDLKTMLKEWLGLRSYSSVDLPKLSWEYSHPAENLCAIWVGSAWPLVPCQHRIEFEERFGRLWSSCQSRFASWVIFFEKLTLPHYRRFTRYFLMYDMMYRRRAATFSSLLAEYHLAHREYEAPTRS